MGGIPRAKQPVQAYVSAMRLQCAILVPVRRGERTCLKRRRGSWQSTSLRCARHGVLNQSCWNSLQNGDNGGAQPEGRGHGRALGDFCETRHVISHQGHEDREGSLARQAGAAEDRIMLISVVGVEKLQASKALPGRGWRYRGIDVKVLGPWKLEAGRFPSKAIK